VACVGGEHDWNRVRHLSCGGNLGRRRCENDVDLKTNKFGSEWGQLLNIFRSADLNNDIVALEVAEFAQANPQRLDPISPSRNGAKGQEAHVPHLIALLRPRRERPRRHDAEQRNKLAASQLVELHSIPASQGRIAGYPIGEDQSGGNERGSVASPENQLRSASS
jgi:hypothetical protein